VFKLLAMLVTFLFVALALLALRQHRLELTSQSASIYESIRDRHQTLLDQRAEIAKRTNPWALANALNEQGVNTGEALRTRATRLPNRDAAPAAPGAAPPVETDLVAPLLDDGHAAGRPR
jgi:hypothetical protein